MKHDGRLHTAATKETIRKLSVARIEEGEQPSKVALSFGYNRSSAYPWMKAVREGGSQALVARKQPGRPTLLSPEQQQLLRAMLDGKTPQDYGFDDTLWDRAIVAKLIEQQWGIHLTVQSVGNYLRRLGLSFQRPLRRAHERNPRSIERWRQRALPRLLRWCRHSGWELFFLDEAGVRDDVKPSGTWAPRGKRPEVPGRAWRQHINAISAVNPHGDFWFRLYKHHLGATEFMGFLLSFLLTRTAPVLLVVDGHPAHTARSVRRLVRLLKDRVRLAYLPPYAPELNPDELVWSHLKTKSLARHPLQGGESLERRVYDHLTAIGAQTRLVRSFFRAPSVGCFDTS